MKRKEGESGQPQSKKHSVKEVYIPPQDDRYTTPEGEFICYTGHIAVGKLCKADSSCEMAE